jgi:hypothetical protein
MAWIGGEEYRFHPKSKYLLSQRIEIQHKTAKEKNKRKNALPVAPVRVEIRTREVKRFYLQ